MPKNLAGDKLYLTLQEIATHLPARLILEVGVSRGHSSIPLAKAARANGGHLWSIDILGCTRAKQNMRNENLTEYWTFEKACSWEWTGGPSDPFDLAFIDGDHANASKDWEAFEPRVKQKGLILLHDYFGGCQLACGRCPKCLGTRTLVDTVIRPQWERWECATLPYGYGLTIVRKR
jgi:predicted O-methyltransferase YrrM